MMDITFVFPSFFSSLLFLILIVLLWSSGLLFFTCPVRFIFTETPVILEEAVLPIPDFSTYLSVDFNSM